LAGENSHNLIESISLDLNSRVGVSAGPGRRFDETMGRFGRPYWDLA